MIQTQGYCPEDKMAMLLKAFGADTKRGTRDLEALLREYPADARLHFLNGSFQAGREDYAAACQSMLRAVEIAPDFHVARFQLGFLLLTSGRAPEAEEAWAPLLQALPDDHCLFLFIRGLQHLIRDEFDDCIRLLELGIANNRDNLPLTRNMSMIIEEIRRRGDGPRESVSSVNFLLQQAALKPAAR